MKPSESQAFRIHEYEIFPGDGVIRGPAGVARVPGDAMTVLVRLVEKRGEPVETGRLCGNGADPPDRDALERRIRELRRHLGGDDDSHRVIEPVGDDGYRLVAPVSSHDDVVLRTDDGPIHVRTIRDDDTGDFLLDTDIGPLRLHPIGDAAPAAGGDRESWFQQLRQKRVFRAIASYAVVSWLLLQIVDVLSGALPVPNWTMTAAAVAVACGFPLVAIFAWTFQITPDGIVVDVGNGRRRGDGRGRFARHFDLGVIAVLLIVVAFLSWDRVFPSAPPDSRFALAVLPFKNLSGDPADRYLSDGIADDIRSRLFAVPQLLVAAARSSRALASQDLDVREIGARLDVEHVLEGSVRRSGNLIRVSVQLVDVASGFNRWSKHYDTDVGRVLELENDIALVVASELELLLSRELRTLLAEAPTDDAVAHGLYLQARDWFLRPKTGDSLVQAQRLFEQAIARDPRFAMAHAGLCRTLIARYGRTNDVTFVEHAERECRNALRLDDETSDVHTALGELYLASGRVADAEVEFEAAIALNARAIDAQTGLADVYARRGKTEEAEAQYRLAIERLPGNWDGFNHYARFLLQRGRFHEAIRNYQRVVELTPGNANALNNIGAAWYFLGDFEKAGEFYDRSLAIQPNRAAYSNSGTMHYFAGNYFRAVELFQRAADEADSDYRLWGNLADAQRFIPDERDTADTNYERAIRLARTELALDDNNVDALLNIAWYLANLGRRIESQSYLERALDVGTPTAEQRYIEALVLTRLGKRDSAEAALRAALDAGFPRAVAEATPEFGDVEPGTIPPKPIRGTLNDTSDSGGPADE